MKSSADEWEAIQTLEEPYKRSFPPPVMVVMRNQLVLRQVPMAGVNLSAMDDNTRTEFIAKCQDVRRRHYLGRLHKAFRLQEESNPQPLSNE